MPGCWLCTSCVKAFKWLALLYPKHRVPSLIYTIPSLSGLSHQFSSSSIYLLSPFTVSPHLPSLWEQLKLNLIFFFVITLPSQTVADNCLAVFCSRYPPKAFLCIMQARCNHSPSAMPEWKPCGLIYCRRHLGKISPEEERATGGERENERRRGID